MPVVYLKGRKSQHPNTRAARAVCRDQPRRVETQGTFHKAFAEGSLCELLTINTSPNAAGEENANTACERAQDSER